MRRFLVLALAVAVGLALAVAALAALPAPGTTFTGFSSEHPYNGYRAAVGFKVSPNGRQALSFWIQDGGCVGIGGPGNAYADPFNTYRLGTIAISPTGSFTATNVRWVVRQGEKTKTTTSTLSARFTTPKTAVGTIRYSQTLGSSSPCTGRRTFTAHTP